MNQVLEGTNSTQQMFVVVRQEAPSLRTSPHAPPLISQSAQLKFLVQIVMGGPGQSVSY